MNDFLQSLRNGQTEKQRPQKTRKNYDNSYHYNSGPNRFGYQNNRSKPLKNPSVQNQSGNQLPVDDSTTTSILAEAIETLSIHVESLTKNQDFMINAQEKTADMLERQTIAIEKIADHLNNTSSQKSTPQTDTASDKIVELKHEDVQKPASDVSEPVKTPVQKIKPAKPILRKRKKTAAKTDKKKTSTDHKLLSRDAVMDIINSMRDEGATFDQVASHLVKLGQPTFSGRGEWHAQTIHRLCNIKKK